MVGVAGWRNEVAHVTEKEDGFRQDGGRIKNLSFGGKVHLRKVETLTVSQRKAAEEN